MYKISTRDHDKIADYIAEKSRFQTNGALRGEFSYMHGYGTVYSYAEPIAVYNPETMEATMTSVKFSVTTSRHASTIRRALDLAGYRVTEVDERLTPHRP